MPDYTVQLDTFQGPLDLLLFLIRRAEVDITDIPIARIADQYVEFLRGLERIDVEQAGEFLVMAATLMEIKSRMLMPPESRAEDSDGEPKPSDVEGLDSADPRYELVKQLLAYKRFRDAAETLDHLREEWLSRVPIARAATPDVSLAPGSAEGPPDDDEAQRDEPAAEIEDLGVWDLFSVFQRIIEAVDFGKLGDHKVEYDDTPIALYEEDLIDALTRSEDGMLSLRGASTGRTRAEMIGLFLATLELVRQRRVTVVQDRLSDDIILVLREDKEAHS